MFNRVKGFIWSDAHSASHTTNCRLSVAIWHLLLDEWWWCMTQFPRKQASHALLLKCLLTVWWCIGSGCVLWWFVAQWWSHVTLSLSVLCDIPYSLLKYSLNPCLNWLPDPVSPLCLCRSWLRVFTTTMWQSWPSTGHSCSPSSPILKGR